MNAATRLGEILSRDQLFPLASANPRPAPRGGQVYVALLKVTQREYDVAPWRIWLQTLFTGSDVFHVQVAFDNPQGPGYVTYSTDAARGVFADTRKTFSRDSWKFYAVNCTSDQYTRAIGYCDHLVSIGAGFNGMGADCQPFWPWSGHGRKFFCSELVAEVLKRIDLIDARARPEHFSPGDIQNVLHRNTGRVFATTPPVERSGPPTLLLV